jgi:hypothetical protein
MNGIKSILNLFAVIALCVICSSVAQAQATRTWVSGVGDDANPCSRTAPCKTFAGAISKTAANGEINVLDPGGFGGLTINKNITVKAVGTIAGVLTSGTNGITVNAAGIVVNLVGLDMTGLANGATGVRIIAAGKVSIQNCDIYGYATGVDINVAAATQVNISNTAIHDNSGNGVNAIGATGAGVNVVINQSNIFGNSTGIRADNNSRVSVANTVISGNTSKGVDSNATVAGQSAEVNLEHCEIVNQNLGGSGRGISSGGTTTGNIIRIANCSLHTNNVGFFVAASNSIITFQNNNIDGNGSNSGSLSPLLPQ